MKTKKFSKIKQIHFIIIFLIHIFANSSFASALLQKSQDVKKNSFSQCSDVPDKATLVAAWHFFEPYQCNRIVSGRSIVTCLDIELMNTLSRKINTTLDYMQMSWDESLNDLKNGDKDMVGGATFTDERAKYALFSVPYRYEQISLFSLYKSFKQLDFHNLKEFFAQMRLLNFRLGVTRGYVYGEQYVTDFFTNEKNNDIIIPYDSDVALLNALLRGEIDGFIADRVLGLAIILNNNANDLVKETSLGIQMPIHLMFSQKTVSLEVLNCFNQAIEQFIGTDDYKKMVKIYIYHVLLPKAVNSNWCYIIGIIGTLAFAISGIALAAKENASLFGTFILAILPSIAAVVLLDTILATDTNTQNFIMTPTYVYFILIAVLVGFFAIKVLDYYNKQLYHDHFISNLWNNTLIICDALGQASFIIIGVITAVINRIEPLWFWGPCFAFLVSNAGYIARDMFCTKNRVISCVSGDIHSEISILWGMIFVKLLDVYSYNPTYNAIKYSVISVITGAFVTRLLVYYFNIPNLRLDIEDKIG